MLARALAQRIAAREHESRTAALPMSFARLA